jgi:hypothetical protein
VPFCRPECGIGGCLSHVSYICRIMTKRDRKIHSETITAKKQTARVNIPSLVDICLSTPEVPLSSILVVPERIHFMPCIQFLARNKNPSPGTTNRNQIKETLTKSNHQEQ